MLLPHPLENGIVSSMASTSVSSPYALIYRVEQSRSIVGQHRRERTTWTVIDDGAPVEGAVVEGAVSEIPPRSD